MVEPSLVYVALAIANLPVSGMPGRADWQLAQCENLVPAKGALGYRRRGDERTRSGRCEGLYQGAIPGGLELMSFTAGPIEYNLGRDSLLTIGVNTPSAIALRVQVRSIPARMNYQMDAAIRGADMLRWPLTEVVRPLGLGPRAIGVVGWLQMGSDRVYVPVRVLPEGRQATGQTLVVLRANVDLRDLRWRLIERGKPSPWRSLPSTPQIRAWDRIELPLRLQPGFGGQLEVVASTQTRDWATLLIRMKGAP